MKHEKGSWRVVRNCCMSGNCSTCLGYVSGRGSIRVVQADGYSERYAQYVANNWSAYAATAEPMLPAAELKAQAPAEQLTAIELGVAIGALRRAMSYLERASSEGQGRELNAPQLAYPFAVGAAQSAVESALAALTVTGAGGS